VVLAPQGLVEEVAAEERSLLVVVEQVRLRAPVVCQVFDGVPHQQVVPLQNACAGGCSCSWGVQVVAMVQVAVGMAQQCGGSVEVVASMQGAAQGSSKVVGEGPRLPREEHNPCSHSKRVAVVILVTVALVVVGS
jgi:hypothetical protein